MNKSTNKPKRSDESERASKKWWTVDGHSVIKVTGYSCAPSNPDKWWCPEVGYTLDEKHHLFSNERDALDSAIEETQSSIASDMIQLTKLKQRRDRF